MRDLTKLAIVVGVGVALHRRITRPQTPWSDALVTGAKWGLGTWLIGRVVQVGLQAYERATTPRTFVSHHHGPDGPLRDSLVAHAEARRYGLSFSETSPRRPIRSEDPARVRGELTRRIRGSDQMLVIVGQKTHERAFVRHEIRKAKEAGVPIVAVKRDRSNRSPHELLGAGASWAMSDRPSVVARAIARSRSAQF